MSYTGNLSYADEQNIDVAHPDYVPIRERRRAAQRAARNAAITFARLEDGSWGIKGVGLVLGATATVTRKDGSTTEVVVNKIVSTDKDGRDYATFTNPPRETVVEVTVEVPADFDATAAVEVPNGRYAVYNDDQSVNDIAFYKVDNVTSGRWEGFTFVKQIVGPNEQRLSQKQGRYILAKIAAFGVREASQLFGQSTQKCGVCNTNLTNKESREYGIGPDCRAKQGW